ncbi:MAG TPA: SRPBCC domain-containing protein [Eudoraea sp.]|nr:SRPBCC domain-containing protein [Eudoraea sp.]
MTTFSFDSFTKKIYIKAPQEKLWWCWATQEGICAWFLKSAIYVTREGITRKPNEMIQPGDQYTWEWHNWDGREKGVVLQSNGRDFFEFSFAEVSKVAITLEDHGNAVLVSLQQHEIPTDEGSKMNIYTGCSNGWTFWLANLKAYLEHGILLNETEFDLTKIPQAGHIFVNM